MALTNDVNDVFGSDVSRHRKCLDNYFATYNSMMETIKENYNKEKDVQKAFYQVLSSINLQTEGYSLSFLRDEINKHLTVGNEVSNQIVKDI